MIYVVRKHDHTLLHTYTDWECNAYDRALQDIKVHAYRYLEEMVSTDGSIIMFVDRAEDIGKN